MKTHRFSTIFAGTLVVAIFAGYGEEAVADPLYANILTQVNGSATSNGVCEVGCPSGSLPITSSYDAPGGNADGSVALQFPDSNQTETTVNASVSVNTYGAPPQGSSAQTDVVLIYHVAATSALPFVTGTTSIPIDFRLTITTSGGTFNLDTGDYGSGASVQISDQDNNSLYSYNSNPNSPNPPPLNYNAVNLSVGQALSTGVNWGDTDLVIGNETTYLTVSLEVEATAGIPMNAGGTISAEASIDPIFTIDPSVADPQDFHLIYDAQLLPAAPSSVPEPGTLSLLAGGLIGIGVFRRRRGAPL
jgi:hypothetical protein